MKSLVEKDKTRCRWEKIKNVKEKPKSKTNITSKIINKQQ